MDWNDAGRGSRRFGMPRIDHERPRHVLKGPCSRRNGGGHPPRPRRHPAFVAEENDIADRGAHDVPALREVLGAEAAEVQQKKRSAREENQGNQNERRAGGERLPKPARWKMGQSRRSKSPSRKGTKLFSIMATHGSYCLFLPCG